MKVLYYNCTFALCIFRVHKLGIETHAYAHYTLLCLLYFACFALQCKNRPIYDQFSYNYAIFNDLEVIKYWKTFLNISSVN